MENLVKYCIQNSMEAFLIVVLIVSIVMNIVDFVVIRLRDNHIKALKERVKLLEELSEHKDISKPMNLSFGIRGRITSSYIGKDGETIINGFELEGVDMLKEEAFNPIPPDDGSGVNDKMKPCW